jgi:hypothetical protein
MPMTQPLPAEGSFNWYPWASEVHNDLNGISAFGATLIDDADAATARTTIGALSSAAGAVGATNLATDAVTTVKILDANVTAAKVASEAWTSWTPTVTQFNSVSVTNTRSRYMKIGRTVHFGIKLSVTSAGTAGSPILISAPFPAAADGAGACHGSGNLARASTAIGYQAIVSLNTVNAFCMLAANGGAADPRLGVSHFTFALASGDVISLSGTYESAS